MFVRAHGGLMAHRRQNGSQLLFLLAILGGGGLVLSNEASVFRGNFVAALAVLVVPVFCFVLLLKLVAAHRQKRTQRSLLKKVFAATQEHLAVLVRRRMQLVQPDAYGNEKLDKWTEEVRYFLFDHLWPSLSLEEQQTLNGNFPALAAVIDHTVQDAVRDDPSFRAFSYHFHSGLN